MFKIFPGTFTSDGRKVPIKEAAPWQEKATTDQVTIHEWQQLYANKIQFWAIPTGADNGIIVLDIDVKEVNGFETAQNFYLPQTCSQRTPSGGMHLLYRYPQDGKFYGNRVKFAPGLDVRAEGGFIASYGLDNTPIAEAPQWLLDVALSAEKVEVRAEDMVRVAPDIVQRILEEACDNIVNAGAGESNDTLNTESYRVGQLIPSGSLSYEEAYNALFKAAKERGKPDREAQATINSGLKGGGKQAITSPFGNQPPVLTIPELEAPVQERWTPQFFSRYDLTNFSKLRKPQLFKDWSTEDITITTADGGTGKTTLKLNEAIALALGESFLGFECMGEGRTLFITGEDTREKIGAMIGVILKQMGLMDGTPENEAKVRKVLNSIIVKKDSDLCLITKGKDGFINYNADALKKLTEAIEDLRPRLIVFDPISSFWGSESALNDMSKAVAKFLGILVERSNASVEVINHVGKESSRNKDLSQFAGRGGTGLPSHARVSRALRPVDAEEYEQLTGMQLGEKSAILCNINKFSDGSPLYNKPFIILRDGYLFSRVTLVEQKIKEAQEKMSDTERVFTFIAEERQEGRYPSKTIVISNFLIAGDKIPRDRVTRALDVLLYIGHMGQKIKLIENPDMSAGGKVYIITDEEGREV